MSKTPLETIRVYCLHCNGGNDSEVKTCDANKPGWHICPFHPYRMRKGRLSVKVFRKFCLQCMGGHVTLVSECKITDCPCYPYRMGRNPAYAGKGGRTKEYLASLRGMTSKKQVQNQRSPTG